MEIASESFARKAWNSGQSWDIEMWQNEAMNMDEITYEAGRVGK